MMHRNTQPGHVMPRQLCPHAALISDQNYLVAKLARGQNGPGHVWLWVVITSHRINNDSHRTLTFPDQA